MHPLVAHDIITCTKRSASGLVTLKASYDKKLLSINNLNRTLHTHSDPDYQPDHQPYSIH